MSNNLPPNPFIPNLYNSANYFNNNESLTISLGDARYLQLTGGILSGLLFCSNGLSISGSLVLGGTVVSSNATQINYLSGVLNAGTAYASSALVLNSSKNITGINSLTTTNLNVFGTATNNTIIEIEDANNSSVGVPLALYHVSNTGSGSIGMGVALSFNATNSAGNTVTSAQISGKFLNATAGSIQGQLTLSSVFNGSFVQGLTIVGTAGSGTTGSSTVSVVGTGTFNSTNVNTTTLTSTDISTSTFESTGIMTLSNTTSSSSSTVGAVVMAGGLSITNNTNSTNYLNGGCLTLGGGIGINGDVHCNGYYSGKGISCIGANNPGDYSIIFSSVNSNVALGVFDSTNGAIALELINSSVSPNTYVDFIISNTGNLTINTTPSNQTIIFSSPLQLTAVTTASTSNSTGVLLLSGGIGISNVTDAVSSTNGGCLTVAGGMGIAKQLFVGGNCTITGSLSASGLTVSGPLSGITTISMNNTLTNTLSTASTSDITGALILSGGIGISNTTDAISSINGGSLTTGGGMAIGKSLYVGTNFNSSGFSSNGNQNSNTNTNVLYSTNSTNTVQIWGNNGANQLQLINLTETNVYTNFSVSTTGNLSITCNGTSSTVILNGALQISGTLSGVTTLTATTLTGTLSTASQTNITSVGTLTSLTLSGTLAMGSNNITSTGTIGGTCSTIAQPNITSLGTLTSLTTSGVITSTNSTTSTSYTTGGVILGCGMGVNGAIYSSNRIFAVNSGNGYSHKNTATSSTTELCTWSDGTTTGIGAFTNSNFAIYVNNFGGTLSNAQMYIDTNNNTHIQRGGLIIANGTTNPLAKLDLNAGSYNSIFLYSNTIEACGSCLDYSNGIKYDILNSTATYWKWVNTGKIPSAIGNIPSFVNTCMQLDSSGNLTIEGAFTSTQFSNSGNNTNVGLGCLTISGGTYNGVPLQVFGSFTTSLSGAYGYIAQSGSGTGSGTGSVAFGIKCTTRITCTEVDCQSDYRIKKNFGELTEEYCKNFIKKAKPCIYNMKIETDLHKKHIGFIAQDLIKSEFHELVNVIDHDDVEEIIEPDGFINPKNGLFVVNHNQIIAILTKSIQLQNNEIEKLENIINLQKIEFQTELVNIHKILLTKSNKRTCR